MDFHNVNPINVRLNLISGNLLPLTSDDKLFPAGWRIYSVVVLLLLTIQISVMILGVMHVQIDKIMEGSTIGLVLNVEVFLLFTRMYSRRNFIGELIRRLNDILRVADETMSSVVRSTMKLVATPLKFYYVAGLLSLLVWYGISFSCIFEKQQFLYEDYRIPSVLSKEPFSRDVFVLGNVLGCIASMYIFTKNVALNVYMMNIVLLMTAQYRYIATGLANVFRQDALDYQPDGSRKSEILALELKMKALCRHYNTVVLMTPMMNKILALNFSLIYTTNVFRLSCVGITLVLSTTPLQIFLVVMYLFGGMVQLYILCFCVHQLLDASVETTDKAFHEQWYRYGPSFKSSFLLMILGNNLDLKLSTFGKYNLSLPSFMTILNQAYSVTLLFLRVTRQGSK